LAKYTPRREQVESYSENKCDDRSFYLGEVFQDDWDTHTPPKEKVELYVRMFVKMISLYFLIYCLRMSAVIVVRKCVLSLEFSLREGSLI